MELASTCVLLPAWEGISSASQACQSARDSYVLPIVMSIYYPLGRGKPDSLEVGLYWFSKIIFRARHRWREKPPTSIIWAPYTIYS